MSVVRFVARATPLSLTPNFSWVYAREGRLQPFQEFLLLLNYFFVALSTPKEALRSSKTLNVSSQKNLADAISLSPRDRAGVRGNATSSSPHRPICLGTRPSTLSPSAP